jgi:hypothetical protein
VDGSDYTIGRYKFADNVKILDTVVTDWYDIALYKKIYPQRLDGLNISASSVLYCEKNASGEISEMILKNVTGDMYSYGVITARENTVFTDSDLITSTNIVVDSVDEDGYVTGHTENTTTSTTTLKKGFLYTINIDGYLYNYKTTSEVSSKIPCRVALTDGLVEKMDTLKSYSGTISKLTTTTATIGNNQYKLSDRVLVYKKTSTLMKIPIEDAINGSYKLKAYYDKSESEGGRIRVIIAE